LLCPGVAKTVGLRFGIRLAISGISENLETSDGERVKNDAPFHMALLIHQRRRVVTTGLNAILLLSLHLYGGDSEWNAALWYFQHSQLSVPDSLSNQLQFFSEEPGVQMERRPNSHN
jgi:hypothetical protein